MDKEDLPEVVNSTVDQDINFIGVMQQTGLVEEGATQSQGFEEMEDALVWVKNNVYDAHGEPPVVTITGNMVNITSPGGPVQGWVFGV